MEKYEHLREGPEVLVTGMESKGPHDNHSKNKEKQKEKEKIP